MQHEFKSHGEKRRYELQQRMKAERARADAENEAGPGVAVERQVTPHISDLLIPWASITLAALLLWWFHGDSGDLPAFWFGMIAGSGWMWWDWRRAG